MSNFIQLTSQNNSLVSSGVITGPTGSFQNLAVENQIQARGGITGPTGSFQNLAVENQIQARGGITGPTGSFQNLAVVNNILVNNIQIGRGNNNVSSNTSVGTDALSKNISGLYNVAFGENSLLNNTSGNTNTSIGSQSMFKNTTGSSNTSIGTSSLNRNIVGTHNVSIGENSLFFNRGSRNTSAGSNSLQSSDLGNNNVGYGYESLHKNTNGNENTGIGYQSLYSNTIGNQNTGIGYFSGYTLKNGSFNTFLGPLTDVDNSGNAYDYSTALGYGAKIDASNQIILGNSSITALRCQVTSITSLSDARDKKDVASLKEMSGIYFVSKLNPVNFVWNMRDGGKIDVKDQGFIAQELKQIQEETNINIPGLVYDVNPERLEASYGKLIPIMVQAIKDLNKETEILKQEILMLKNSI